MVEWSPKEVVVSVIYTFTQTPILPVTSIVKLTGESLYGDVKRMSSFWREDWVALSSKSSSCTTSSRGSSNYFFFFFLIFLAMAWDLRFFEAWEIWVVISLMIKPLRLSWGLWIILIFDTESSLGEERDCSGTYSTMGLLSSEWRGLWVGFFVLLRTPIFEGITSFWVSWTTRSWTGFMTSFSTASGTDLGCATIVDFLELLPCFEVPSFPLGKKSPFAHQVWFLKGKQQEQGSSDPPFEAWHPEFLQQKEKSLNRLQLSADVDRL